MGGIGSGGHNRKSEDELKKLGTFRPARHEKRIGDVVELPLPGAPQLPVPKGLASAGAALWKHLWLHVRGLSERDAPLVEACCASRDQVELIYGELLKAIKEDARPTRIGPRQAPALARALASMKKELRQDLALLGMSAKDRGAFAEPSRPRDALAASFRRKSS